MSLKLDDYAGYYVRTKTTCAPVDGHILRGRQEVCCLVDWQKRARQIMSSMAYRNYGQLKEAPGIAGSDGTGDSPCFQGTGERQGEGEEKKQVTEI